MNDFLVNLIQNYGIVIMSAAFFLFFLVTSGFFQKGVIVYFVCATVSVVLLAFADAGQSYYAELAYPTATRMFFGACGYALRVVVIYFAMLLFFRDSTKTTRLLLSIPMVINTITSFSAFVWKDVFTYTADNQIVRGPVLVVPFAVSMFYYLLLIYRAVKSHRSNSRTEAILLIFIFFFVIITTTLEAVWSYCGLLSGCCILGLIFYYLFFLSSSYSYDLLTGAYIRSKFSRDIRGMQKAVGIITFDLNDLKLINDTYGHAAGDKALKDTVGAVVECMPSTARLYRIGGDEFVMICRAVESKELQALVGLLQASISKTAYSAAMGYTVRQVGEPFERALARADTSMYNNKAASKERAD